MKFRWGRRITTLATAALLFTAMASGGTLAGDAHVVTDDPLHRSGLHQPMPGDLDYDDINRTLIWESEEEGISTAVLVEDLDDNGLVELVFGTDAGRVLAIEVATKEKVIDIRPTETAAQYLAVGNVDDDESQEIVLTAEDGVYCYDYLRSWMQWEHSFQLLDSQVLLMEASDGDGPRGWDDVVVLRTSGDDIDGPSHMLLRFDDEGKELYQTPLLPPGGSAGSRASCVAADLDGDGTMEVFINDRYAATVGAEGNGRNIWIVNADDGPLKTSMAVAQVVFESEPMLVMSGERLSVAIGLSQGWDGINDHDVAFYESWEGTFRYVNFFNDSRGVAWTHLGFMPEAEGQMMLATSTGGMHVFHFDAPGISWSKTSVSGRSLHTNPVSCDIDDDGKVELLVPDEGITILDMDVGNEEARVEPSQGRAINIRLTAGDLDGDGRSEVVWGYLDDEERNAYQLYILGNLAPQEAVPDIDPMWGWVLVVFVLVANVAMVAYLIHDWNRRKDAEEEGA